MKDLIQKYYENVEIRVVLLDGEPWFVAQDIAEVLEYVNSRMMLNVVPKRHKGVSEIDTLGGPQKLQIISEPGFYCLLLKSGKPKAKKFEKWVISEVLPSIRKTGTYTVSSIPKTKAQQLLENAQLLVEFEARQIELEKQQLQLYLETRDIKLKQNEHAEIFKTLVAKTDSYEEGVDYFSIIAFANYIDFPVDLQTAQQLGKKASKLSEEKGIMTGKIKDQRYGSVKTYHISVLKEVFGGSEQ